MKKLLSLFLAIVSVFTATIPSATADTGNGVIYAYGDINFDQKIDAVDALMTLQYAVDKLNLDAIQTMAAEVNGSNTIDAADALLILQFSVGKIIIFPKGKIFTVEGDEEVPAPPVDTGYHISYDLTNSYNGAYAEDLTADCSFVMDNTGLAEKTVYIVNSTVASNANMKRLIISLQGLINRDFGRDDDHTTLVYFNADGSDPDWLTQMLADGICKGYQKVTLTSEDRFFEVFVNQLQHCGMILWDEAVGATANVAATICGLDGYLPVLAGNALQTKLEELGVEVKQSLVGLFTGKGMIPDTDIPSTTSAKNDAYYWAMEKYFSRCSSQYLAYTLDGNAFLENSPFQTGYGGLTNHDYFIARRAFFYDLDPYTGNSACDDPSQPVGLDAATMRKLFLRRYERANGAFGMAMGFPPWWSKYSQEYGGSALTSGQLEPYYTELVTCYNLAMEADCAHPCEMTNGSVYYKYVPDSIAYKTNQPAKKMTYNKNHYYFIIYVGDYDSSAWLKKYVHSMWLQRGGDRNRGKLPLMWSFNPNLAYRVPLIFHYVRTEATANDYFAAGNSGAGYVHPTALYPDVKLAHQKINRPEATGNAAAAWAEYSKKFYRLMDLDITGFIINTGHTFDKKVMDVFNVISPVGSTYYNGNDNRLLINNGVPYIQCRIGVGKGNPNYLYNWAKNSMLGYHFAAYRTVNWTPTELYNNVNDYIDYAAGKGMTVHYVDPYNFFDMIRQSGEGYVVK